MKYTERLTLTPLAISYIDITVKLSTNPVESKYHSDIENVAEIYDYHNQMLSHEFNGYLDIWCASRRAGQPLKNSVLVSCHRFLQNRDNIEWSLLKPDYMPDNEIEISYCFKYLSYIQGDTTETWNAILPLVFEKVSLTELVATNEYGNQSSRHILLQYGLEHEARRLCYREDSSN